MSTDLNFQAIYEAELNTQITNTNDKGFSNNIRCPFSDHDDKNPSFAVNVKNGYYLCHGCGKKGSFFDFYKEKYGYSYEDTVVKLSNSYGSNVSNSQHKKTLSPQPSSLKSSYKWTLLDKYNYYDENNVLKYKVEKFFVNGKKQFIPSCLVNGEWIKGLKDEKRLPYDLTSVLNENTIFIAEGEKDVNTLKRLGLPASCNSGGAGNWPDEINHYFKSKDVILLSDNDKAGFDHVQSVVQKLHGISKSIKIVNLPNLKEKEDVTNWIENGNTKEALLKIVEQTQPWQPISEAKVQVDEWEKPLELVGKIPEAPTFPIDSLPVAAADYVRDNAERMQCPPDLLAIPVLAVLAGVIGKHARIRPKKKDDWSERPCLWGIVIASKGQLKSPTLKVATAPLLKIQNKFSAEYNEKHSTWKEAAKEVKEREKAYNKECHIEMKKNGSSAELPEKPGELLLDDKPIQRRVLVNDTTVEKLADIMQHSPGLTLVRDELAGFLLNMSRYNSGSDRQFYLECYSGGSYQVDRVTKDEQFIDDLYLNIVGGIQPPVARKLFSNNETDDGFFERFGLMTYPDKPLKWVDVNRYPNKLVKEKYNQMCFKLSEINWNEVLYNDSYTNTSYAKFSDEAQKIFDRWLYNHMNSRNNEADDNDMLAGLHSKKQGLLAKLALVIHLSEWAAGEESNPKEISQTSLVKAISLIEDYFVAMWKRVFAAFGSNSTDDNIQKIAKWIKEKSIKSFTIRDIKRKSWKNLKGDKEIFQVIEHLIESHWIKQAKIASSSKGGRPGFNYLVNPNVCSCS